MIFFCCKRCKIAPLCCPPHLIKNGKQSVTVDDCSAEVTLKTADDSVGALSNVVSRVTSRPSETVKLTCNATVKKTTKKIGLDVRAKIAKSSESVYYHKFLEIKCSYSYPNDLDKKKIGHR